MVKQFHTSGRRKKAIARATIMDGKGVIRINKKLLEHYSPWLGREKINEPLIIAGEDVVKKVDIDVSVRGGGWLGQSEATRLAIAKALVGHTGSKKLEKEFLAYDRNLMVADVRHKEPYKPNDSKARAKRQKSYR
ncbi:MAG TPA: 30S ribosomal protein S9 [Candidatus Nanoarchaeia archaeon]|nr:30S ribosomal protein S9 [Candidatus Nanoarchaeia archaeon]